ncbi:MAG: tRNA pseudouridine(55) synthase TruB [Marinifilaceae bacterium]|jgi:tRNA pseudouridine55 synthase|nr:tRNA pseudouridine(55) synthase TruB [Marinifilaceae bacterium]
MIKFETENDFQQGALIVLNKPYEWTSFDLVNKIKFKLKHKYRVKKIKVGHAGTLDPLATGLMLVCVGKYTKKIESLQSTTKEYIADIKLGESTPSFDLETEVDHTFPTDHITIEKIQESLTEFVGDIMQRPPTFSAVKVDGKRAYSYARAGKEVEIKEKPIRINSIEILSYENNILRLRIDCGKGTYIRSLARDIGQKLDSGAHLTALQRTKVGEYNIENALEIEDFISILEKL